MAVDEEEGDGEVVIGVDVGLEFPIVVVKN